ncbi:uncharacterized protein PG998_004985 [Apiospora kogelbergensis]|uniref:Uncharacterized protein n=1 Tax=Apiospora kogelbergensis TaxID=1337665 RepID=A0AAW0QIS7_9PEZI
MKAHVWISKPEIKRHEQHAQVPARYLVYAEQSCGDRKHQLSLSWAVLRGDLVWYGVIRSGKFERDSRLSASGRVEWSLTAPQ